MVFNILKDMMVLLDLLGVEFPVIKNAFNNETGRWFKVALEIQQGLKDAALWNPNPDEKGRDDYFQNYRGGGIQDDHIPFLQRGVPILHWIAQPFPDVWHELTDNKDALHFPTIENFTRVVRLLIARYLHLTIP